MVLVIDVFAVALADFALSHELGPGFVAGCSTFHLLGLGVVFLLGCLPTCGIRQGGFLLQFQTFRSESRPNTRIIPYFCDLVKKNRTSG